MFPALAEAAPASHFFDTDESRDVEVVARERNERHKAWLKRERGPAGKKDAWRPQTRYRMSTKRSPASPGDRPLSLKGLQCIFGRCLASYVLVLDVSLALQLYARFSGALQGPFLTPRGPPETSPYLRRRGRRRRDQGGLERKEDWADRGGMFGGENRAWKW